LNSRQISKEEYSRICEQGILLDKTKYKRNQKTKISVVIPYFNKGFFSITILLRSIQNQSFKDIEIIFVDDGSYEEDIKNILYAMKDDNRIILIRHKERKTTLLTRVDGIRHASGEYIIQIDQDDIYLNNLLFEKLYKKAKELNVDIVRFCYFFSFNKKNFNYRKVNIPKNVIIKQPELKTVFFVKKKDGNLGNIKSRTIWDKFVRRTTYLEAIEDLTDEYMNNKFHYYEDTIMMFELSQIANSYFFYEITGYRHCKFNSLKTCDKNKIIRRELFVMNQFLFIKLLINKIDPKYDRTFVNIESIFRKCGTNVEFLNKKDLDLGLEVIETILELEKIYKNTNPLVLNCTNKLLKIFEIHIRKIPNVVNKFSLPPKK
jgi:glycosyltransferase involved in cell wall biosynthesis